MGQLGALVALRWRMVRTRRTRVGLAVLAGTVPALSLLAALGGARVPPGDRLTDILLLAPTTFVLFATLAVAAPMVAGGGNQLFPDEQLVGYPIRPAAVYGGSVLLSPLNLAWATQVVLLCFVTGAVTEHTPLAVLGLVTTFCYIALATVVGQTLAWLVVGMRQRSLGRRVARLGGWSLGAVALALLATGRTTEVLDASPTTQVVISAIKGSQGRYGGWLAVLLPLALGTLVAWHLGVRACAWALRRTSPLGRPELRPVVRRASRTSVLGALTVVDWASVWRSTPLRRGTLVLAVLPGAVGALADPSWPSLALIPGLVAAGAGLLFGVNAFALDGGGTVFVAAQPHAPWATLAAKVIVVAWTCLAAIALALVIAASQVDDAPTAAAAVAVVASALASTLVVTATCASMSVAHPHKADLRGPRDTPAPPATMATYSLQLALVTTWPALVFVGAAASGSLAAAVLALVAVVSLSVRSLLGTFRRWQRATDRSRVVTTVAFG